MRFNGRGGLITVLAVALVMTGACGGDDKDEGSTGKKVELTVDVVGEPGFETSYKQFEAANPNIKVKQRKVSQLDQYAPRLAQWMATGSGAGDVVMLEEGILVKYTQQPDKFVDLNSYGGAALRKNFLDWKWKLGLAPDGKKLIGLGTDIGPLGMCYRKDLFQKAGLPTSRDEVSKLWPTWDALVEVGKRFQGKVSGTKFLDGPTAVWNTTQLQEAGKGTGHTYFDPSGKLVFDTNPVVRTAFDTTMKFQTAGLTANAKIFTPPWISGIQRDGFAVIPCPAWMLGGIEEFHGAAGKGKWDVAAVPGGAGYWGGSWMAVPKQSKHPKEAAELAKFLTNPETQLAAWSAKKVFPSSPKYYDDPVVAETKSAYFGDAPIGKIYGTSAMQVKPVYLGAKNNEVRDATEAVLLGVGQGKIKPAEAWQKAVDAAQKAAR